MNRYTTPLHILTVVGVVGHVSTTDILRQKREGLRATCSKYDDPLKYEYNALHQFFMEAGRPEEDKIRTLMSGKLNPIDGIFFCDASDIATGGSLEQIVPATNYKGVNNDEEKMVRDQEIGELLEKSSWLEFANKAKGYIAVHNKICFP